MDALTALDGQLVQLLIAIGDRQVKLRGMAHLDDAAEGTRCLHINVEDDGNQYEIVIEEKTWNGVITPPVEPTGPYTLCLDAVTFAGARKAS